MNKDIFVRLRENYNHKNYLDDSMKDKTFKDYKLLQKTN